MADGPVRPLEREGVRFFGAIGAGLSHELSNVFNIINELSGLQQAIGRDDRAVGTVAVVVQFVICNDRNTFQRIICRN